MRSWVVRLATIGACFAMATTGLSATWAQDDTTPATPAPGAEQFGPAPSLEEFDSLIAALPEMVRVTYASGGLEETTGALLIEGVSVGLGPAGDTLPLTIGDIRLWGLNSDFILARMRGERLDEGATAIGRIEINDLAFTYADLPSGQIDAAVKAALLSGVGGLEGVELDPELGFTRVAFALEQIVFENLGLRPFDIGGASDGGSDELRSFVALTRSLSADTLMFDQTRVEFDQAGSGPNVMVRVGLGRYSHKDVRGLDIGSTALNDISVQVAMDSYDYTADPEAGSPWVTSTYQYAAEAFSLEGLRLDKAVSYVLTGEMPPMSETDLMSLGIIQLSDQVLRHDGNLVYSQGLAEVDLSKFHWFIPTRIQARNEDVAIDIEAYLNLFAGPALGAMPPEMSQLFAAFGRNGPTPITYNDATLLTWNPGSGETEISYGIDADELLKFDIGIGGRLPSYDAATQAFAAGADRGPMDVLGQLMMEYGALEAFSMEFVDQGGGDIAANVFSDMAGNDPDMARYAEMSAQELRLLAAEFITQGASEPLAQMPFLGDFVRAATAFVQGGGALRLSITPQRPVDMAMIGELQQLANSDPQQIIELLGVELLHTPAKDEGGGD